MKIAQQFIAGFGFKKDESVSEGTIENVRALASNANSRARSGLKPAACHRNGG